MMTATMTMPTPISKEAKSIRDRASFPMTQPTTPSATSRHDQKNSRRPSPYGESDVPKRFVVPTMKLYDGITDPNDRVDQ